MKRNKKQRIVESFEGFNKLNESDSKYTGNVVRTILMRKFEALPDDIKLEYAKHYVDIAQNSPDKLYTLAWAWEEVDGPIEPGTFSQVMADLKIRYRAMFNYIKAVENLGVN